MKKNFLLLLGLVVLFSCASGENMKDVQMANPASVNCINKGGKYITVEGKGGTAGYCIFKDGSICAGWDYYKGKCNPGDCAGACRKGPRGEGYYDCSNNFYGNKTCVK